MLEDELLLDELEDELLEDEELDELDEELDELLGPGPGVAHWSIASASDSYGPAMIS